MAKVTIKSKIKPFKQRFQARSQANLRLVVEHYKNECKRTLSVSAGGRSRRARRVRRYGGYSPDAVRLFKSVLRKGGSRRQAAAAAQGLVSQFRSSLPGEPPRLITGFLHRNVRSMYPRRGVGHVGLGENAMYGFYLDRGFTVKKPKYGRPFRVLPRPWIMRTFWRELPRMQMLAVRELK